MLSLILQQVLSLRKQIAA
uniref:Uncharacterized protein n=1 Tax=Anguilla anguilla TaxID=7936 RepID=A0A0E9Q9U0_ANGAN